MTDLILNPLGEPSPMVRVPAHVAALALNAITNDPRREPYGHHEWGRTGAVRHLRAAVKGTRWDHEPA